MNEIVSEALPIHFWPIGQTTWNDGESVRGFVDRGTYFHEQECDDQIKLQVSNENAPDYKYRLKLVDRNNNVLGTTPFIKTLLQGPAINPVLQFGNKNFSGTLNPWLQQMGVFGNPWNWIFDNKAKNDGTVGGFGTAPILYQNRQDGYPVGWAIGNYNIHITGINASTGPDSATLFLGIVGSDDDFATNTLLASHVNVPVGAFNYNLPFATIKYWKNIGVYTAIATPGNNIIVTLTLVDITLAPTNETYAEYDLSFDLLTLGVTLGVPLCDQKIRFYIQRDIGDGAGFQDAYKSDYIQFSAIVPVTPGWGSKLIYYSSINNFAGINYPNDGNPFILRIPCRFFRERNKDNMTELDLSNSESIITSNTDKDQRILEVSLVPDYIHKKIRRALQHCASGQVTIDGKTWIKEEAYEYNTIDKKSPMQMASTWLTDDQSLSKNLI